MPARNTGEGRQYCCSLYHALSDWNECSLSGNMSMRQGSLKRSGLSIRRSHPMAALCLGSDGQKSILGSRSRNEARMANAVQGVGFASGRILPLTTDLSNSRRVAQPDGA